MHSQPNADCNIDNMSKMMMSMFHAMTASHTNMIQLLHPQPPARSTVHLASLEDRARHSFQLARPSSLTSHTLVEELSETPPPTAKAAAARGTPTSAGALVGALASPGAQSQPSRVMAIEDLLNMVQGKKIDAKRIRGKARLADEVEHEDAEEADDVEETDVVFKPSKSKGKAVVTGKGGAKSKAKHSAKVDAGKREGKAVGTGGGSAADKAQAKTKAKHREGGDAGVSEKPEKVVLKRPAASLSHFLGLVLGCSKCRRSEQGCAQCRNPLYSGRRG